ncbi:hypothetical protein H0Z60_14210 [Ectothiorhodospiraceae bacterium WFHF3C12]|nr:hypothetical protein [Ectothiorhodospiraceae bacterium WFHF3C12]
MQERVADDGAWCGDFELAAGELRQWRIGPMTLVIQRGAREWRLRRHQGEDPLDPASGVRSLTGFPDWLPERDEERFIHEGRDSVIRLQPRLPDRAVVGRPVAPVRVPAGGSARVYLSVPLWVVIGIGNPQRVLAEYPTFQPSDTWFGPSPVEGELCYAVRTRCRLSLEDTDRSPARAVIPLRIRNDAGDVLALERVSVPAPLLSLYRDAGGRFWTEAVDMRRVERDASAEVTPQAGPPQEAGEARRVEGPRRASGRSSVMRAFGVLFQG